MHDPKTVAFDIRYPWKNRKSEFRDTFVTIWHNDPETDGTDDSCGWFIRSRHLDQKTLEKVVNAFEFEWDRTFCPGESDKRDGYIYEGDEKPDNTVYSCGWFHPDGDPHKSVIGITLSMFWTSAFTCLGHKKAKKYMKDHLWEIIHFAENNVDSLHDGITRKFYSEEQDDRTRKERIESMASCIYSYIMRDIRPWYKHPKWHIRHWSIQIHPLQRVIQFLFDRCHYCKKRFKWGEARYSGWNGGTIWHSGCENSVKPPVLK